MRVVTPSHEEWPEELNELGPHAPPKRLHVEGAPIEPVSNAVSVVGTRRPTGAGVEAARSIARGLAEGRFAVISGLAVGIDAAAHAAALEAGGRTIAVLGSGLDVEYPKRNLTLKRRIAQCGTLVTEYPAGSPPNDWHFPLRNRIIVGLSRAVVVIEGSNKSGALITARAALDANRAVFAVPGSIRNPMAEGPNELIRSGQAALVTNPDHIFEDLAPGLVWGERHAASDGPVGLEPDERELLGALDDTTMSPDQFCKAFGMSPGRVAVTLARLEVRGWVIRRTTGYEISTAGARVRRTFPDER